jgi:hypothetical protein
MAGIANLKKSVELVKDLVDTVEAVMADGKVDLKDISEIPDLYRAVSGLISSVKAVIEAGEHTDLDFAEGKELAAEAMELVKYVFEKF